jgi:hypothetical protein
MVQALTGRSSVPTTSAPTASRSCSTPACGARRSRTARVLSIDEGPYSPYRPGDASRHRAGPLVQLRQHGEQRDDRGAPIAVATLRADPTAARDRGAVDPIRADLGHDPPRQPAISRCRGVRCRPPGTMPHHRPAIRRGRRRSRRHAGVCPGHRDEDNPKHTAVQPSDRKAQSRWSMPVHREISARMRSCTG